MKTTRSPLAQALGAFVVCAVAIGIGAVLSQSGSRKGVPAPAHPAPTAAPSSRPAPPSAPPSAPSPDEPPAATVAAEVPAEVEPALAPLPETEDELWQAAIELRAAGELWRAEEAYEAFLERFPSSSHARDAKKVLAEIQDEWAAECIATAVSSAAEGVTWDAYEQAIDLAGKCAAECPKCKAVKGVRKTIADLRAKQKNAPTFVRSVRELRVRYADLRGRVVFVKGAVVADDYYNCGFASPSRVRSFILGDADEPGSQMHVYCERGNKDCDDLHRRLAPGGAAVAEWLVRYLPRNSVCEESQAQFYAYADPIRWVPAK